eukprot:1139601-Pelagomonas_calceolata.AAC.1
MGRPASWWRCCALVSLRFFKPKWDSTLSFLCRDTRHSDLLAHEHGRHFAIPAPAASKSPLCKRGILFMLPRVRARWRLRPFPAASSDSMELSCSLLSPTASMLMSSSATWAVRAGSC